MDFGYSIYLLIHSFHSVSRSVIQSFLILQGAQEVKNIFLPVCPHNNLQNLFREPSVSADKGKPSAGDQDLGQFLVKHVSENEFKAIQSSSIYLEQVL